MITVSRSTVRTHRPEEVELGVKMRYVFVFVSELEPGHIPSGLDGSHGLQAEEARDDVLIRRRLVLTA